MTPQQQQTAPAAAATPQAAAAAATGADAACIPAATQHALPGLFASLLQEQQRQQAAGQRQLVDGRLQWQKQQQPGLGYPRVLRLFETPVWGLAGIHEPWDGQGKQLRELTESFARWELTGGVVLAGCSGLLVRLLARLLVRGPWKRLWGQQHLAHCSPLPPACLPFDGLAVLSAARLPAAPGAEKVGKSWYCIPGLCCSSGTSLLPPTLP